MLAIGIDIGGTKIAGALVSDDGSILREDRKDTPAKDPARILDIVHEMIVGLAATDEVVGVGVAVPGFIDAEQETVYYTPNIDWRNEPLRQRLSHRLDIPVFVDNDANAAGWAEYVYGAGRGVTDMTMLTIGTGVGGAIISGGHLFRGGFGTAAELGHLRVVPDGLACGCGSRGCIEMYGSGRALERYANEIADTEPVIGMALADARGRDGRLHGADLGQLIESGDPGALRALAILGDWIGQAAATIAAVLDPQMVVIGGGVAAAGELLLSPIRESYRAHLPARGFHPETEFRTAELVNNAGVVGAADLARASVAVA